MRMGLRRGFRVGLGLVYGTRRILVDEFSDEDTHYIAGQCSIKSLAVININHVITMPALKFSSLRVNEGTYIYPSFPEFKIHTHFSYSVHTHTENTISLLRGLQPASEQKFINTLLHCYTMS